MVISEEGGVWDQATEVTLPSNVNTGTPGAELTAIACASAGACVAGGQYGDSNGHMQAMVLSSVASLALSTSTLPAATVGSPYSAQLAANGGVGNYTWSIGAGSLPDGLSLNPATGVISGIPVETGTPTFTIGVTDPGPPAQTTTEPLSITVEAAATPPPTPTMATPAPPANTTTVPTRVRLTPPNTAVSKSIISSRTHTARFTLTAQGDVTRFQCALVKLPARKHAATPGPKYVACMKSRTYTHLQTGHYMFYARAIGPDGTEKTPATHRFSITA
jgi:hypothetical protein